MPAFTKRLLQRLYWEGTWRCSEAVVVLESDDWGLERCPTPSEWADEAIETAVDLERMYRLLERHSDRSGRPACMTANFVVGQPDVTAIQAARFARYVDKISGDETLQAKWREGVRRRVIHPQYHGRAHFRPEPWLADLQADVRGARALLEGGHLGGLSLLRRDGWRYHTEYVDWRSRCVPADLDAWLAEGLAHFEPSQPLYLTSTELAGAIRYGGRFHDIWTGAARRLTPRGELPRRLLRKVLALRMFASS